MKRYIYILCAVLMGVFASCSKSEMGGETPQFNQVTLKVATDEGLQTRANATGVNRYAIEVYTDASYTTMADVFSDGTTNRADNAIGVFSMTLDRTKAYYCLLWADKDGKTAYTIASLKDVTLTGKAVEAWHGTKTIAAGTEAVLTATLTRAVSKISLMESGKLGASATLKLNFFQPTKFNVATKTASATSARPEEVITISTNVDGTITPAKLNATDIFVLSSVATADLTDLTFQYNAEATFTVSQAPLKANFNTNINGHYTSAKSTNFTVTADDVWGTPDNNVVFPIKVGDFYMNDGTWLPGATTLTTEQKAACIGIVYVVNADGKTGKIVGLIQSPIGKLWGARSTSESKTVTGISSTTDGATATKNMIIAHKDEANFATDYSAFEWVYTIANAGNIDGRWYIPAKEELKALYGKYAWDTSEDASVKTVVNLSLNAANATLLSGYYWSSTEHSGLTAWSVNFNLGSTKADGKLCSDNSVRVVSAF